MPLPFLNGPTKKRDQIIAVDLGARSTKAVHLQRRGDVSTLLRYCVMDAPIYEKSLSVDLLADHLKAICLALEAKSKFVSLALSINDSIVRQTELPPIPVDEMRQILKNNSKTYLQQDLPGHVFDCYFINRTNGAVEPSKPASGPQKAKVLVGGAKKQLTDDLQAAVKQAGLIPDQVIPGIVCPSNAFELAMPEIFKGDAVALVDIGFKNTSICLLQHGDLIVSRVVNIGGDKLTQGLSEAMNISYAEAEGIKVGMPAEVQSNLEPLLMPLGRELRASIDFFEHQQDRTISQVYISGGSARSEFIMKTLETELMVPCKSWSPVGNVQLGLPPAQASEIEQIGPQLTIAMGTAAAAF
ncbi:MAG TPA: pilus assembly protein PilM [Verrucomicrobiae bacterium]|nr:pilus assembly protein PilM [Verrucomicrobiae bacterium]